MPPHRLSLERIEHAAMVIDPVFLHTPQFLCEPLGDELSVELVLKVETLNPIRSFTAHFRKNDTGNRHARTSPVHLRVLPS